MAVKLAYNKVEQFADGNGIPYSGAKLFTYVGGSVNTKQTTYTESTGTTPNTNPLVLDSAGRLPQPVWLTTGASYKFVLAPSTDTDPPTSPIWTLDGITGVNDSTTAVNEWVTGPAPTFVSATSFTLVGDQTSTFHVGRRVKTTNSGGTVYSTILTSAFAALTTITVVNDSGTIDSGLSAVSYGLLAATNPSVPLLADTFPVISGSADKTKKMRFEVDGNTTATTRIATPPDYDFRIMSQTHGADVASAGTLNLDTATGDLVDVTGTTSITAVTLAEGKMATVRFTGVLTLTNGASLVLPGAANITTAAGDFAVFRGYAAGVVRCQYYPPLAAQGSSLVLLSSKTASASASLSFGTSDFSWTAYDEYIFKFTNLRPATDAQGLLARYSTDGGSSFLSDANYNYAYRGFTTGNVADDAGATGATGVLVLNSVGNSVSFLGLRGTLELFSPSTVMDHACLGRFHYVTSTSVEVKNVAGTYVGSTTAINGIQFLFQAGNITSGSIRAYGVKTA